MTERLINPIDGLPVDEVVKEKEAKSRGYLDLEFILRHLEDENEFVKLFTVDGKRILVDMEKPMTQYRKPVQINHERLYSEKVEPVVVPSTCAIDDPTCESCSG